MQRVWSSRKSRSLLQLDQVLAILGIFAGLPSLLLAYSRNLPIGLSLTLIVSCSVYIVLRRTGFLDRAGESPPVPSLHVSGIVNVCFVVLFCLSIIVIMNSLYVRTLQYFLILTGISGLITFEIFASKPRSESWIVMSVLPKILCLALNLQLGRYMLFPTLVGVDPFAHSFYAEWIISNGHVLENAPYTAFPGAQIAAATLALVSAIPSLKVSLYLSIGLLSALSLIVVFKTARLFIGIQASLLATLLASLSTFLVGLRLEMDAQALGLSFFIFFFYLLMKVIPRDKHARVFTTMLFLFVASLTVTHTLSTFILLVTLMAVTMVLSSRREFRSLSPSGIAFSVALFVASYWIFASEFLNFGLALIWLTIRYASVLGFPLHFLSSGESDFAWSGTYILYAVAIVGSLAYLSPKMRNATRTSLVFSIAALLGISYSFLVVLSSYAVIPERWYPFALVLAVIPAASTLMHLARQRKLKAALMLVLILGFTFLSTTSPLSNDEPGLFTRKVMRLSFTENEVRSAAFLNATYRGTMFTDMYYGERVFDLMLNHGERITDITLNYAGLPAVQQKLIAINTNMLAAREPISGMVVIRTSATHSPVRFLTSTYAHGGYSPYFYVLDTYPASFTERLSSTGNIIYNSGSVIAISVSAQ